MRRPDVLVEAEALAAGAEAAAEGAPELEEQVEPVGMGRRGCGRCSERGELMYWLLMLWMLLWTPAVWAADLTVTIPDPVAQRVLEGLAGNNNYQAQVPDPSKMLDPSDPTVWMPNPETKAQFAKRMVKEWIKASVRAYEVKQAVSPAMEAASQNATTEINAVLDF